jgi:hypothetical protein
VQVAGLVSSDNGLRRQLNEADVIAGRKPEMRAYEPTLMDQLRYKAIDVLAPLFGGDERAANAYYRDKVQPTAEFLPGVGDAMAAAEAKDAFGQGDYLGGGLLAAGAAAGLVPGVGDAVQKGIKAAVKSRGDEVLGLLKSGKADQVTDEMLDLGNAADNANLNAYLFDNYDLPMDEASRMARAQEYGFEGYHGTTHDFPAFDAERGNYEGHFGRGNYFTSEPLDAGANYAGEGPDLTGRITQRAEQLASELDLDYDDPKVIEMARRELVGPHQGAIIPAMVRGDVVDVRPHTRGGSTALENNEGPYSTDDFIDDAKKELGDDADEFEIRARASEIAFEENSYHEPEGKLANFAQGIRDAGWRNDFDADEALEPIQESLFEGYAAATDLDKSLRGGPLMYAENPETGALIGNDVIRQGFVSAGYPNILMDAPSAFPNMQNIPEGTEHLINSSPEMIRSRFARFDPRLKHLRNLSAGVGGGAVLANEIAKIIAGQKDDQTVY